MIESLKEITELIKYKELLRNLIAKDIKIRYKRSVLGFFWVMLHPLLMMAILSMVFSGVFHMSGRSYPIYTLSGFIVWNLFSQSTSTSLISFIGNRDLIKKIYLPKSIFPLSVTLSALIHFVFALLPLLFIISISGAEINPRIVLLPLLLIFIMLFCYGISLILSTATVFFHDAKYIYEVLLVAGMYITPIFYPESIVPGRYAFIIRLNPLSNFLSAFRGIVYLDGQNITERFLYGALSSLIIFIAGWLFYNRFKDRVVYHL